MNTNVSEIRYLVLHDPRPLKFLFRSPSEDKKRLSGIIGRMIPYRIGIEFELFGTISNLVPKSVRRFDSRTYLIKKFNLKDYSEDLYQNWSSKKEQNGELNEIRVSIEGVRQLNSLWNVITAIRQNCLIPADKGGIHIHIDFSKQMEHFNDAQLRAKEFFSRKEILDRVINIFEGYKGSYNKRGCGTSSKRYWINISNKHTIEFRIGKLTFDYKTIIRWIVSLSKLVTECSSELSQPFKSDELIELEVPDTMFSYPDGNSINYLTRVRSNDSFTQINTNTLNYGQSYHTFIYGDATQVI